MKIWNSGIRTRTVRHALVGGLAAFSLSACADADLPDDGEIGQIESNVEQESVPVDTPSPGPVAVSVTKGKTALESLAVTLENLQAQDQKVTASVQTFNKSGPVSLPLGTVAVGAKLKNSLTFALNRLPVQRINASVPYRIVAEVTGDDGVVRRSLSEPLWISHEKGYTRATVRTGDEEAKLAPAVDDSFAANIKARDPGGRELGLDGKEVSLGVDGVSGIGFDSAAAVAKLVSTAKPFAENAADGAAVEKSGTFNFCINFPYSYVDSGFGEDFMTATSGGWAPARYHLAYIRNNATGGQVIGVLNSSGCTGNVNYGDGDYTILIYPQNRINITGGTAVINVQPSQTSGWVYAWQQVVISPGFPSGTYTANVNAAHSVFHGSLAAGEAMLRGLNAFRPSTTNIYTEQDCNGLGGCRSGDNIFLGNLNNGRRVADHKVAVIHELGHQIQAYLYGIPTMNSYSNDSTAAACKCDHVVLTNNLHCLQSRHTTSAAQVEGWAQFFASRIWNSGLQTDCSFAYYKEFRNDNGTITQPPMAKSCYAKTRWMENHCNLAGRGTEFDWMSFYWWTLEKSSYSFNDYASVYNNACAGSCSGKTVSWASVQTAANAVFGSTSAKAQAWATNGVNYGVNH